ncbi:hypothetical protein ACIQLJ_14010 [Microbacterium sp. NPDC091313]
MSGSGRDPLADTDAAAQAAVRPATPPDLAHIDAELGTDAAPSRVIRRADAPAAGPHPRPVVAPLALVLAVVGLVASLLVGWAAPIGLVAAIAAIVALRRPVEPRGVAWWALGIALLSLVYSAGWLLWALPQL